MSHVPVELSAEWIHDVSRLRRRVAFRGSTEVGDWSHASVLREGVEEKDAAEVKDALRAGVDPSFDAGADGCRSAAALPIDDVSVSSPLGSDAKLTDFIEAALDVKLRWRVAGRFASTLRSDVL